MRDWQQQTLTLGRREVIAGAAGLVIAGATAAPLRAQTATGEIARGTVFDADANGGGIPGVMVSNGRDVVKTDAEGRWALPVAPGDSVFVIKPAGWATPVVRAA